MAPVDKSKVPWWVSNLIVPLVNLILALLVSGLFIFIAGENPYEAVRLIIYGSFGYIETNRGAYYGAFFVRNYIEIYWHIEISRLESFTHSNN